MNAQELMIGDWVYGLVVDEGNDLDKIIEKVPSKVTMINEFGDVNTTGLFPIDDDEYNGEWELYDIEPIPITAEILERNGFVQRTEGKVSRKSHQYIRDGIYISWWRQRLVVRHKQEAGRPAQYMNVDCRFIHELQHALRMAGIEKEVAL